MESANLGLCNKCRARVPAEFFVRDGQTWIRKDCPACGPNESLVSSDAAVWQSKRDLWRYVPTDRVACSLDCDRCRIDHKPNMVFLDVTNHCNMNCPICIATIRGMGFDFHPPLEYFERILVELGRMDPRPVVQLFGGEPTLRDDLLEIITIAKKNGLKPHVVTNGVKLADEEYCRKLCEARVPLRFGFDGRSPDIYERLRRNRPAYEKKMKALENLKKYSRRKHAIIACAAWGINDQHMADLIQFCHDNRDLFGELGIIPLTENWDPGTFDAAKTTTMEDVEKMVRQAVPGGEVEFVPAGLAYAMRRPRSFFRKDSRSEILLLGGVHPNCESMTLLISDGRTYRSVSHYLKKPFSQVVADFVETSRRIDPALARLDRNRFFQRLRGQYLVIKAFGPLLFRTIDVGRLTNGHPILGMIKAAIGQLLRLRSREPFQGRSARRVLRVAVLPFEELHSIDAARMENCKAVFAYEDADDGRIKTIPACMWYPYRNAILKKISDKYGVAGHKARAETPATI